MKVGDKEFRTIWLKPDDHQVVCVIDQRFLPHQFRIAEISSLNKMELAIREMWVRGAGLIGASGAWGMYLSTLEITSLEEKEEVLKKSSELLLASRPTAVNLSWAVNRMLKVLKQSFQSLDEIQLKARQLAQEISDEDAEMCRNIGLHGVQIIEEISQKKQGKTIHILTHCNAGWLAFVDFGSALAPIYEAHNRGIDVHVFVDETRPRNQGASLTAWELLEQGIPHTIIADNTGGYLMQKNMIDLVIVGSDRCTRKGDIANKIGTYLKALAAFDNQIPFYAALPSSTIDWSIEDGLKEIPIEQRSSDEVKYISGLDENGNINRVLLTPLESPALNYGFDITPARFISGIITEKGIAQASEKSLRNLFSNKDK